MRKKTKSKNKKTCIVEWNSLSCCNHRSSASKNYSCLGWRRSGILLEYCERQKKRQERGCSDRCVNGARMGCASNDRFERSHKLHHGSGTFIQDRCDQISCRIQRTARRPSERSGLLVRFPGGEEHPLTRKFNSHGARFNFLLCVLKHAEMFSAWYVSLWDHS